MNSTKLKCLCTFGLLVPRPCLIPRFLRFKCKLPCWHFQGLQVVPPTNLTWIRQVLIKLAFYYGSDKTVSLNAIMLAHPPSGLPFGSSTLHHCKAIYKTFKVSHEAWFQCPQTGQDSRWDGIPIYNRGVQFLKFIQVLPKLALAGRAEVGGFEPPNAGVKVPCLYHLATPQYVQDAVWVCNQID